MTKNVWRCRCGKRAEVLTDENFGDCGCSDPVYGPEYFYMSEECADMLDEMDKDYDEQHKQLAEARAEIENKQYTITCASEENQQLKESLAEARAEVTKISDSYKRFCMDAKEDAVDQQKQLAEARAEIERLQEWEYCMQTQSPYMAAGATWEQRHKRDQEVIAERDKLIELMRAALRAWVRTPNIPLHEAIKLTEAALEAGEEIDGRAE
jgi:septal ring factor EnvC (AmiA/AmiB activator)